VLRTALLLASMEDWKGEFHLLPTMPRGMYRSVVCIGDCP
jgi:hypothetical protein